MTARKLFTVRSHTSVNYCVKHIKKKVTKKLLLTEKQKKIIEFEILLSLNFIGRSNEILG
jgi:hypothetical protein